VPVPLKFTAGGVKPTIERGTLSQVELGLMVFATEGASIRPMKFSVTVLCAASSCPLPTIGELPAIRLLDGPRLWQDANS
jgi:hypothetical protein